MSMPASFEGQAGGGHGKLAAAIHLACLQRRDKIGGLKAERLTPAIAPSIRMFRRNRCQGIPAGADQFQERFQTVSGSGYRRKTGHNDICQGDVHSASTREVILPPKAKELDMARSQSLERRPSWQ